MPIQLTRLQVFVASPSDVAEERQRAKAVIDELRQPLAASKNLDIEYVGWDTHTIPTITGKDAQTVINKQIGAYDIFVGIMWTRFGSPTPRADAATVEEFRQALRWLKQRKISHILFYFGNAAINPQRLSIDDIEQLRQVILFKKEVGQQGLYEEYDGVDDFEKRLRKALTKIITDNP